MIKNIYCGLQGSLILTDNNKLFYSGSTLHGCSGLPVSFDCPALFEFTEILLPTASPIRKVCVGLAQHFLLCEDNSVWVIGVNTYGQLGVGQKNYVKNYTLVTTFPKPVQTIVVGAYHSLALLIDGSLWAVGRNEDGELGLGDKENRNIFTKLTVLPPNKTIVGLAAGDCASFIIFEDGSLWAAGLNEKYSLGLPQPDQYCHFTSILQGLEGRRVVQVVSKFDSTFVLLDNKELKVVGKNIMGQLGVGHRHTIKIFTTVEGLTKGSCVQAITAGDSFCLILLSDNTIWGAGKNLYGQVGMKDERMYVAQFTKANLPDDIGIITAIAAGRDFTLINTTKAGLLAVGSNSEGALGLTKDVKEKFCMTPVPLRVEITEANKSAQAYLHASKALSPLLPGAYQALSQQFGEEAKNLFKPNLVGCEACNAYMQPSIWDTCIEHTVPDKPAIRPEKREAAQGSQMSTTLFTPISAAASAAHEEEPLAKRAKGLVEQQQYVEALSLLRQPSMQQNPEAQYQLGCCYLSGHGVDQDEAQAFEYFYQSAIQGYAEAEFQVADCFEHGIGTEVDSEQALDFYLRAAAKGHQGADEKIKEKLFTQFKFK